MGSINLNRRTGTWRNGVADVSHCGEHKGVACFLGGGGGGRGEGSFGFLSVSLFVVRDIF